MTVFLQASLGSVPLLKKNPKSVFPLSWGRLKKGSYYNKEMTIYFRSFAALLGLEESGHNAHQGEWYYKDLLFLAYNTSNYLENILCHFGSWNPILQVGFYWALWCFVVSSGLISNLSRSFTLLAYLFIWDFKIIRPNLF